MKLRHDCLIETGLLLSGLTRICCEYGRPFKGLHSNIDRLQQIELVQNMITKSAPGSIKVILKWPIYAVRNIGCPLQSRGMHENV